MLPSLRRVVRSLAIVSALTIAGVQCGESIVLPDVTVASITVNPLTATVRVGASVQLEVTAANAAGSTVTTPITLTASDPTVISVSSTGLVQGLRVGTSAVIARAGTVERTAIITVTAGNPASLSKTAGDNQSAFTLAAVAIAPAVQVRDVDGNPVADVVVNFAVAGGGGTITGGTASTNASGIATVGSWTLGASTGPNVVTASVPSVTPSPAATFTATALPRPGQPAQLVITTPPANAIVGSPFGTQPVVEVRDGTGAIVATATNPVTASLSASGRLIGTATVNAVAGVARFTGLGSSDIGPYVITFASPGLTSATANITVQPIPLPTIVVPTPPTFTAPVGGPDPTVGFVSVTSSGAQVSGLTISSVTYSSGGSGWLTATLSGGTTPTNLVLELMTGSLAAGTYTADITIAGTNATSAVVPVRFVVGGPPGSTATAMVITTQPSGGESGAPLTTQPVITLRDANGNTATAATNVVTASLPAGSGGTLSGTTTVSPVNGVATFTDLRVSPTGTYSLEFTSSGLPTVVSNSFLITLPGANPTIQVASPSGFNAVANGPDPVAQTLAVTSSATPISGLFIASITYGPGASGWLAVALAGTTTPTTLTLQPRTAGLAVGTYTAQVQVTGTNATSAVVSVSFTVRAAAGAPASLAMVTTPTGGTSGGLISLQPSVEIRDVNGARITQATNAVTVSLASGTGTLTGTLTVNAVNGVATFTDLRISPAGNYSLQFTSAGLAPATTPVFPISP